MKTYTYASDEAYSATVTAMEQSGKKYPMELNSTDFSTILNALLHTYHTFDDGAVAEQAGELAADIASTLDIEWI